MLRFLLAFIAISSVDVGLGVPVLRRPLAHHPHQGPAPPPGLPVPLRLDARTLGRELHLVRGPVVVPGQDGPLHVPEPGEPPVAHVEHHVPHDQLDKVGEALKVGVELVALPDVLGRVRVEDGEDPGRAHGRSAGLAVLRVVGLDEVTNAKGQLVHRVLVDVFAVTLMDLEICFNAVG